MDTASGNGAAPDTPPAIKDSKDESPASRDDTDTKEIKEDRASVSKKSHYQKAKKSEKSNRDEKVMETNGSSIVSKRSVERTYLHDSQFYRYFVKKPHRRSPLIHRGYWLRMHAVEQVVQRFLKEPSEKKKVVVNLGCGYDPSPYQFLSKDPERCGDVTFVDVDYPELMSKKRDVIGSTSELQDLTWPLKYFVGYPDIVFWSDQYVGIGCDLQDTTKLNQIFERHFQLCSCRVLCVAEVSITYMDVLAADALINWATQYEDVRFCLLEQFLPDGNDHPFAQKMLQHFANLSTPLKSVSFYPSLKNQEFRFLQAGYDTVHARSLWHLWQDSSAVAADLRLRLNKLEPFDEWEELALFASHYFTLEAVKGSSALAPSNMTDSDLKQQIPERQPDAANSSFTPDDIGHMLDISSITDSARCRRFGAIIPSSGNTVSLHGGLSNQGRLEDTDGYWLTGFDANGERSSGLPDPPSSIPARQCHTITALSDRKCLLLGGRQSPDRALSGCWFRSSAEWRAVEDVPIPVYRHCATAVAFDTEEAAVLVFGGRTTGGAAVNRWFLWQETMGWDEVLTTSENLKPRFGAAMASTGSHCGLLLGGMTEEGSFCDEIWEWTVTYGRGQKPTLVLKAQQSIDVAPRMGACLVQSPIGLLLIGGVSTSLIPREEEVVLLTKKGHDQSFYVLEPVLPSTGFGDLRPLLIGHAAYVCGDTLLIVGGGAVCFSFGCHCNHNVWTLKFPNVREINYDYLRWVSERKTRPSYQPRPQRQLGDPRSPTLCSDPTEQVLRVKIESADDFDRLMAEHRPIVMEGLDLGRCTKDWTVPELERKINPYTMVTVHEAQTGYMNFQNKNFRYVKKPFGEFIQEVYVGGSRQYLRSLAAEKPADEPARFYEDFPALRDDFCLPPQLRTVALNEHSSPLRISGPVNMWLHYDVMANVLCQISGEKVVALYPPSDAVYFAIPPGSSSSPINVFSTDPDHRGRIDYRRHHIRAALGKGDVLYIPPLWLHSTAPMENLSVSVNVFFRNLTTGYAAGRDVYGNRDMQAYENGRKSIDKMVKSFNRLPEDIGSVYLERLAHELLEKAKAYGKNPT
ncbi:MAG: hypothetical protein Q9181_000825 [Wetmoreana brouardii]